MADVKFNFSSEWPTVQVVRVISDPINSGPTDSSSGDVMLYHGLGYPPLAIGLGSPRGSNFNFQMEVLSVDENYLYITPQLATDPPECAVIYAVDISEPFSYPGHDSAIGTPLEDTSGGTLDLRDFLLHSRAVGPMLLDVATKTFSSNSDRLTYYSKLPYPTFSFGFVHTTTDSSWGRQNRWVNARLGAQAYPRLFSDGFISYVHPENIADQDRGSIVVLRNPAIILHNTVTVTL